MDHTDAGGGDHRDDLLGDAWHVDDDAIALFDAHALQRASEAADLVVEIAVGNRPCRPVLAFPVEGDLVAGRGAHMAIECVVDDIGLTANEPLGMWHLPVQHLIPRLEPVQLLRHLTPELLGVLDRPCMELVVAGEAF